MNEFDIMQNNALGALVIFSFVKEYHSAKDKMAGPVLPLIMPVLPIIFHEDTNMNLFKNQKRLTSFYKALAEHRTIPVGLQKRMEHMYSNTMKSLNLALNTEIVIYNSRTTQVMPQPRLNLLELNYQDNQSIIQTSKLLGFWFSKLSLEEICVSLNIRF